MSSPGSSTRPRATERRVAAVITAGVVAGVLCGAALGVLWWRLAPRVPVIISPDGSTPNGFQPEGYLAADIAFGVLAAVAGVAIAVGLATMRREHLWSVLVASLLSSAIGTLAMWWVGTRLGTVDIEGLVATTSEQVVVDGPLSLSLPAMFLVWPIASAVVVTILALTDAMSPSADVDDESR